MNYRANLVFFGDERVIVGLRSRAGAEETVKIGVVINKLLEKKEEV